jgi:hypothetical protein
MSSSLVVRRRLWSYLVIYVYTNIYITNKTYFYASNDFFVDVAPVFKLPTAVDADKTPRTPEDTTLEMITPDTKNAMPTFRYVDRKRKYSPPPFSRSPSPISDVSMGETTLGDSLSETELFGESDDIFVVGEKTQKSSDREVAQMRARIKQMEAKIATLEAKVLDQQENIDILKDSGMFFILYMLYLLYKTSLYTWNIHRQQQTMTDDDRQQQTTQNIVCSRLLSSVVICHCLSS